jgi:hypothetical protein
MASELLSEITITLTEDEQRAILARLKISQVKLDDSIIYNISRIVDVYPEIYISIYRHCYYYNRILDLRQTEIDDIINYFMITYPNPDKELAKSLMISDEEYHMRCVSDGCRNIAERYGLCGRCSEKKDEMELFSYYQQEISNIMSFI